MDKKYQVLLLAGGLGTRLGELTKDTPKPILPVAGSPFLEHLLWNLNRHGLTRVLISTGYLADKIEEALGDGSRLGMEIGYLVESEPLGTGGAIKFAAPFMDEEFFVLNGDTLYDVNYWAVSAALGEEDELSMALRPVDDVARYGEAKYIDGRVVGFSEKGNSGPGRINAGIYFLRKSALAKLPPGKSSIENDLFPLLAKENKLAGVVSNGFFIDIGIPETLKEANHTIPKWRNKSCAFFDRDGIINVNTHHTHRPDQFEWVPGAFEAIRWCNEQGYLVIVVTNQAGIAKGKYTEKQFHEFMSWISSELHKKGAHWDDFFYCPYHPTEGIGEYLKDSEDRKPKPGMILKAIAKWNISLEHSFLIGDSRSDIEAANEAGIPGILFSGGTVLDAVKAFRNNHD